MTIGLVFDNAYLIWEARSATIAFTPKVVVQTQRKVYLASIDPHLSEYEAPNAVKEYLLLSEQYPGEDMFHPVKWPLQLWASQIFNPSVIDSNEVDRGDIGNAFDALGFPDVRGARERQAYWARHNWLFQENADVRPITPEHALVDLSLEEYRNIGKAILRFQERFDQWPSSREQIVDDLSSSLAGKSWSLYYANMGYLEYPETATPLFVVKSSVGIVQFTPEFIVNYEAKYV